MGSLRFKRIVSLFPCWVTEGIFLLLFGANIGCGRESKTPAADFIVQPASGNLSTVFYFDGSHSDDPDNISIALLYRWDFNYDGTWDTFFSRDPKGAYKYSTGGKFTALLEVKDPQGNISQATRIIMVSSENLHPFGLLRILPPRASLGTTVIFDASRSSDDFDSPEDLVVRWDVYGDGSWDSEFTRAKLFPFHFKNAGHFNIIMEIKDSQGASSSLSSSVEILNTNNPYDFLIDPRDHRVYSTVNIGTQWIMAQNLQYGRFVQSSSTPLNNGICEFFGYNDSLDYASKYGGLYLWDEVLDYSDKESGRGVCPPGWHLPSEDDWQLMEKEMGIIPDDILRFGYDRGAGMGSQLRYGNISGFEAGLWGWRFFEKTFYGFDSETRFWTSTLDSVTGQVYVRGVSNSLTGIYRGIMPNNTALSVRCFKD